MTTVSDQWVKEISVGLIFSRISIMDIPQTPQSRGTVDLESRNSMESVFSNSHQSSIERDSIHGFEMNAAGQLVPKKFYRDAHKRWVSFSYFEEKVHDLNDFIIIPPTRSHLMLILSYN